MTYIGIYLKVPRKKKKVKNSWYWNPVTNKRILNTDIKCPETGVEYEVRTEEIEVREEPKLDSDTFIKHHLGNTVDDSVFILNAEYGKYTLGDVKNEEFMYRLNSFVGNHENLLFLIKCFKRDFKDFIEKYESSYGKIEVCFGVL